MIWGYLYFRKHPYCLNGRWTSRGYVDEHILGGVDSYESLEQWKNPGGLDYIGDYIIHL